MNYIGGFIVSSILNCRKCSENNLKREHFPWLSRSTPSLNEIIFRTFGVNLALSVRPISLRGNIRPKRSSSFNRKLKKVFYRLYNPRRSHIDRRLPEDFLSIEDLQKVFDRKMEDLYDRWKTSTINGRPLLLRRFF